MARKKLDEVTGWQPEVEANEEAKTYKPVVAATDGARVTAFNITTKFRESFEVYDKTNVWLETKTNGDIIELDGNSAAASYLVISKDPLAAGTVSSIETRIEFDMPLEMSVGAHFSQRTLGQEFSIEVVSADAPMALPADMAIASISQTAGTLTVVTSTPHGRKPGARMGIRGVPDSRLNYPALVVATAPNATTLTFTAGPMGNLPAVTAGPFTSGFVVDRSALGGARDGTSMICEHTGSFACFYVRADSGDALPSGTILGSHAVAIAPLTSAQAIVAAAAYAFQPTSETRLALMADRVQWHDSPVDTLGQTTARYTRSQVAPSTSKKYKFRVRATNSPSFTRPVAQIVSAAKTGSTTATITTDVPHGLTVADLVQIIGIRDQTSFPNTVAATAIASIISPTQFTIVIGGAVTATSFGGYAGRVNGGQLLQASISPNAQSVSRTANTVFLVAASNWTGAVIGDYVNLVGIRDNVTGASLGMDGAYRVRDVVTTSLVLEPIAPGVSPTGADVVSTNCGGAVIKRTDLRISFVRIFDFERLRIEALGRPQGDASGAMPVDVKNTANVAVTNIPTVNIAANQSIFAVGNAAEDAPAGTSPVVVGGVVRQALAPATLVGGDAARATMTAGGAQVVQPYGVPEVSWQTPAIAGGILNTTTPFQIREAAGAGIRNYVASLDISSDALTNATDLRIREADITCNSQTIASNTLVTSAVHDLAVGDAVVFSAVTAVTGITAGVTYFVLTVPNTTSITLSASRGGAVLPISGTGATATFHKVLWQMRIPTAGVAPRQLQFPTPLRGSPNRALLAQTVTASGAGAVHLSAQGVIAV